MSYYISNPFKILIFISQNATSIVSRSAQSFKGQQLDNGHISLYEFLYLKCPFLLERVVVNYLAININTDRKIGAFNCPLPPCYFS